MGLEIDTILEINEGSTPKITGTLTDENGDAIADEVIDSVTMAVHDYNAGTELRAAASLTPLSGIVTSWLTQVETRIIDNTLDYEYKVITIIAQYNTTRFITEEAYIKVVNLRHHSVEAPA